MGAASGTGWAMGGNQSLTKLRNSEHPEHRTNGHLRYSRAKFSSICIKPITVLTYDVAFLLLDHTREECLQCPETGQSVYVECPVGGVRKVYYLPAFQTDCLTSSGSRSNKSLPWTIPALFTRIVGCPTY